jgi:gamma-glutamyltranspeptidase/glutathione hydrolase
MISTDSMLATEVGKQVLKSGGLAVDAAIATAFALAVVYPSAGNIGGGGFLVTRVDGQTSSLDFRETAPAATTQAMYLDEQGNPTGQSREGLRSAGVPGSVAGLWEAHVKFGTKAWRDLVLPAIRLAEEGFIVDAALAKVIAGSQAKLSRYPASAALYLPGGAPLAEGAVLKNPELATTLKRIADQGPKGFYEGPTATLLVDEMQRGHGPMTAADLRGYRAKWRSVVTFEYRGHTVASMPPPSSGGVTLGMICGILKNEDLSKRTWLSADHLHPVIEAMRRAFAARNAALGDPDFVDNPIKLLLSEDWAKEQARSIDPWKATPSSMLGPTTPASGNGPHTTHLSIVDEKGNAVALTTTVNHWFGAGITVPGAGFVLNNEMDDFALKPGTPNAFGLVQGEPNLIQPNKRMLSSMAPTIVTDRDGKVRLVLGAAGGPTIITAVFQILSNVVDFGFDPARAVYAPRIHHQHLPDLVLYEKDGLGEATMKGLIDRGYELKERDHIADAPSIGSGPGGWIGATEPRRRGAFAAGW